MFFNCQDLMKKIILAAAVAMFSFSGVCSRAGEKPAPKASGISVLADEGEKNPLPDGGWFTWQFDKKPKLGSLIVKVRVFKKDGARNTAYVITGETGMPEMSAHDSGRVKFVKNKKGDYLLPFDVVMPGDWQVVIRVKQGKKEIYAGKILFNI